jgi:hypothetical protein
VDGAKMAIVMVRLSKNLVTNMVDDQWRKNNIQEIKCGVDDEGNPLIIIETDQGEIIEEIIEMVYVVDKEEHRATVEMFSMFQ